MVSCFTLKSFSTHSHFAKRPIAQVKLRPSQLPLMATTIVSHTGNFPLSSAATYMASELKGTMLPESITAMKSPASPSDSSIGDFFIFKDRQR